MSAVIPIECEMYGWDSPECEFAVTGWVIDGPALNGYEIASLYHCGYVGDSRESSAYRYDGNTLTVIEVVQCFAYPCEPMVAYYDVTAPHDERHAPPNTLAVILGLQGLIQNDKEGGASTDVAYPCEIDHVIDFCPEGTSWNDSAHKCLPILPPMILPTIILPNFVTFPDDRLIDLIHGQVIWNDDNSVGVYFDRYVNLLDIINRFDRQTFSLDDSTLLNAPGYIQWRDKFKALISKEESVCESQGLVSDAYGRCKTAVEPMIGDSCEARGYRTAANGDCEIFSDIEIERLLRGERIAPVMAMGDSELVYDADRNVLIVYRPGTDVVLAEQSLDDPKLDPRFQVIKEAAQSSGGTGLIIAAVAGLLLLSNRR